MVMGTYRGAAGGGVGIPGPPGPQGPPGPMGPPSTADVSGTALGVFSQAVMTPSLVPYPGGLWTPLDFAIKEWDTHQTMSQLPDWRWTPPVRGVYQLQASVMLQNVAGAPRWELQVVRSGQERARAVFTGLLGQISWTGIVGLGEFLQVQIRPMDPGPALIDGGPPRTCITIAGVGVV
jgi:hypothetical protein